MATKQQPIDWERIELDYRAGLMSLREIAKQHGITHVAIAKRAKHEAWPRDLAAKIKAKADELVTKAAVTAAVTAETKAAERATVEANATAIAKVRLAHRTDIRKGRQLVGKLLGELEGLTDRQDLVEYLQEALFQADLGDDPDNIDTQAAKARAQRLRDALDRVMQLPGRVSAVKGLAEALKNLIAVERQAWGMDTADDERDPASGRELSDLQRAARMATILARARQAKAEAAQ